MFTDVLSSITSLCRYPFVERFFQFREKPHSKRYAEKGVTFVYVKSFKRQVRNIIINSDSTLFKRTRSEMGPTISKAFHNLFN